MYTRCLKQLFERKLHSQNRDIYITYHTDENADMLATINIFFKKSKRVYSSTQILRKMVSST